MCCDNMPHNGHKTQCLGKSLIADTKNTLRKHDKSPWPIVHPKAQTYINLSFSDHMQNSRSTTLCSCKHAQNYKVICNRNAVFVYMCSSSPYNPHGVSDHSQRCYPKKKYR